MRLKIALVILPLLAAACGQSDSGREVAAGSIAQTVPVMPVQFRGRWVEDPIACVSRNRADTEIAASVIDFAGETADVKRVEVVQDRASVLIAPKDTPAAEQRVLHLRAEDDNTLLARLDDGQTGTLLRCR